MKKFDNILLRIDYFGLDEYGEIVANVTIRYKDYSILRDYKIYFQPLSYNDDYTVEKIKDFILESMKDDIVSTIQNYNKIEHILYDINGICPRFSLAQTEYYIKLTGKINNSNNSIVIDEIPSISPGMRFGGYDDIFYEIRSYAISYLSALRVIDIDMYDNFIKKLRSDALKECIEFNDKYTKFTIYLEYPLNLSNLNVRWE